VRSWCADAQSHDSGLDLGGTVRLGPPPSGRLGRPPVTETRGPSRLILAGLTSALLVGSLPGLTAAAGDLTRPTGTMDYVSNELTSGIAALTFAYSDPESGLDHIGISCDDSAEITVPYATSVHWHLHDGTGGCTTAYGEHTIVAHVYNGDGLASAGAYVVVYVDPSLSIGLSGPAVTG